MANDKTIYGRIDCPICKTKDGVRITKDKNGEPFGFCDAKCEQQLRIGGKDYRVEAFAKSYPEIYKAIKGEAVADTVTETKAPAVEKKPEEVAPQKSGFNLGAL